MNACYSYYSPVSWPCHAEPFSPVATIKGTEGACQQTYSCFHTGRIRCLARGAVRHVASFSPQYDATCRMTGGASGTDSNSGAYCARGQICIGQTRLVKTSLNKNYFWQLAFAQQSLPYTVNKTAHEQQSNQHVLLSSVIFLHIFNMR